MEVGGSSTCVNCLIFKILISYIQLCIDSSFWEIFLADLFQSVRINFTMTYPPALIILICTFTTFFDSDKHRNCTFVITRSVFSYQFKKVTFCSNCTALTPVTTSHKNVLILYVDAGSTTPPRLLSLWEDELKASLVQKSYHLSRLGCDMVCSRRNSCAMQSASKTAECKRFGECVYVASCEQGHLTTPSSPTPTVLYLVSQSQPLPSKDWWSSCICH